MFSTFFLLAKLSLVKIGRSPERKNTLPLRSKIVFNFAIRETETFFLPKKEKKPLYTHGAAGADPSG